MLKWLAVMALLLASPSWAQDAAEPEADVPEGPAWLEDDHILIIAHRGASGERPEHTLAAYELAIDQGADYIEPDLVYTKDGYLVSRHENEIGQTTDVADKPEFADRKTTKTIDGDEVTGWFTEDFSLAELKTLRARERLPQLRPRNTAFDGQFEVPTFEEILALVKRKEAESGRRIGLYPEMKHPTYFRDVLGLYMEETLVALLSDAGYSEAEDPVFIQSFEVKPLLSANILTKLRIIQLIKPEGRPWDIADTSYDLLYSPTGLRLIRRYADGIGAAIPLILHADGNPRDLVENAREVGLEVHAWTMRRENAALPPIFRTQEEGAATGKIDELWVKLAEAGVKGVFTDNVAEAVAARKEKWEVFPE